MPPRGFEPRTKPPQGFVIPGLTIGAKLILSKIPLKL